MGEGVITTLTETTGLVDELIAGGVQHLADAELHDTLRAVDQLRRKVLVLEVDTLAEIDLRRSHETEGAKTAAAYAAWQLPMSLDDARLLVRSARQLRLMPLVADAFHAGTISVEQARMLARCQATHPDAFERDEATLLRHAHDFDMRDLKQILEHWQRCADPDGSLNDAEARYAARDVTLVDAPDGMVLLRGQLDPISGEIVDNSLDAIRRELFEQDWAEAKAIHGDDTCVEHLARTDKQRRADALVLMAQRALMVTPGAEDHGPRPLITVLMGDQSYFGLCETESGRTLDPHDVLRLLTRAEIERVVFDGPSRVIDIGVRQRFFTGATRRAVQVRDRECDHPSCHDPVTHAHIHHDVEYNDGGETVQGNGRVKCPWHHHWHHRQPPPAA